MVPQGGPILNPTLSDGSPGSTRRAAIGRSALLGFVLLLGFSYAFNGLDRSVFPALLSPISKEFDLTLAQGGFLANVFTLNIALFGALSGWFMGRFGRKRTLVAGLIAYSAFTFLIALARNYAQLVFFRAMTGAGEALHIATIFSMLGAYFGERRGTYLGVNNAFFGVGTFLGPFLSTRLFDAIGSWRPPFYLYGVAGIITALAIVLLVPEEFSERADGEQPAGDAHARCPAHPVNTNSMLCVIAFFLSGYSFLAYTALYTLFLREGLGYSVVAAGTAFSLFGIGALTAFVGGWIGEKLRRWGLILPLLIMAVDGWLMFNVVESMAGQMLLSFIFGVMLSGLLYPRFLAVAQRSVQARHIGIVMSMMVPVFYVAGFIAGPVFGKLVPSIGWSAAGTVSVTLTAVLAAVISAFISPARMRGY
jgi:MFS family permease